MGLDSLSCSLSLCVETMFNPKDGGIILID